MILEKFLFSKFKRNKLIFYNLIIVLNIATAVLYLVSYNMSNKYWAYHKNITFSVSNIKYLTALSYLYLKDNTQNEKSETYLQTALKDINILIEGGKINTFDFKNKSEDIYLNKELLLIKSGIQVLIETLNNTMHLEKEDNLKNFSIEFFKLIDKYENIQKYINDQSNQLRENVNNLQIFLYITVGITILTIFVLLRIINKELKDKTKESFYDELTSIQNVKGYNEEILKQLELYERYQSVFSLIMFDIDNFKTINDTYGHNIGDKVLKDLTKLVSRRIRKDLDMFFRVGGEEFLIICSQTSLNEAAIVAQKIRISVEKELNSIDNKQITISLGVSEVQYGDDKDKIYKRVDRLLYKSKNGGKNKVSF